MRGVAIAQRLCVDQSESYHACIMQGLGQIPRLVCIHDLGRLETESRVEPTSSSYSKVGKRHQTVTRG